VPPLNHCVVGADDGALDGEPAEHGLEDRHDQVVVGRQADADEGSAAGERGDRLLERLRRGSGGDRGVRAAEALDRNDRVLLGCVDEVVRTQLGGRAQARLVDVDGDHASLR
jgi:hypothetical protein